MAFLCLDALSHFRLAVLISTLSLCTFIVCYRRLLCVSLGCLAHELVFFSAVVGYWISLSAVSCK